MSTPFTQHRGLETLITEAQRAAAPELAPGTFFYFLRHGQTRCNAERIFQGPDEPLNDTGLAQALQAGQDLAEVPLQRIVSSDTVRTRQTAAAVAAPHGLAPLWEPLLRERNFGDLLGQSSVALDWACAPAQGETLPFFVQRVQQGMQTVLPTNETTLVVAHGGVLHVVAAWLRVSLGPGLVANALPLRFESTAAGWQVTPLVPLAVTGTATAV